MVREIKDLEEFHSALKEAGDKLVVVDFTASWCPPCRRISPVFSSLSEEAEFMDIVFMKVDVDLAQELAVSCEIQCMPTFQFYKNGQKVDEFSGADEAELRERLKKHK
ncbi:hypothetical protein GJAV_G00168480 [Gymnothorax javanicus]|nr:hypothetical protein GJAV_G00168480 [Gymnothorax javanicus]